MRTKPLILMFMLIIFLVGCNDPFSLSTMTAVEYVSNAYGEISPEPGTVNILSTKSYRGGLLVLAKKNTENHGQNIELFMVENEGVTQIASGIAANPEYIAVNQLEDHDQIIIFGDFSDVFETSGAEIPAKAVMTLKSWKIIEEDILGDRGFIVVLKSNVNVQKINLMGKNEEVIAHLDNSMGNQIKSTVFMILEDVARPEPLD